MPRKGQSRQEQKNTKRGSAALVFGKVSSEKKVEATPELVESKPKKKRKRRSLFSKKEG